MGRKKKVIDSEKEVVKINEFCIEDLPYSFTMIVVGPPSSGKTTMMEEFAYHLKHRYPVAKCIVGNLDYYKRFCDVFGDVFVTYEWDEKDEENHIKRQKCCNRDYGKGYKGNYAINLIDDISDDPKIFKTKIMRGLFKIGSQHWAQAMILGTQYAIDMPPDIRKSVSYVALGREPEEAERRKLYDNFGGLAGSYDRFCDLMEQITGDHTFLIFKKRSQSNRLEDCVFWYKTFDIKSVHPNWKFGCNEFKKHNAEVYNKDYIEDF